MRRLFVTIEISLWAMVLTLVFGSRLPCCAARPRFRPLVRRAYLEVIRNTPLLVQLYLAYFVLSPILGLGRTTTGILALAAFEGAFVAEIIRRRYRGGAARPVGRGASSVYPGANI
jgi:polar amino acid transport system permease protein